MEVPVYHLQAVLKARQEGMEDFVGPLDLILHLLSKNKMEIQDIQISTILEQYLQWMKQRKQLDLEVASDFVTMASHLVYIKSRMLLSIHDEEAMSEMEQLIATLQQHQRNDDYLKIKAVTAEFAVMYQYASDYLTKPPEPLEKNKHISYTHTSADLTRAMHEILARVNHKLPPPVSAFEGIVGREPYSVGDKAAEIVARLLRAGVARFQALFHGNRSRSEVVATFLAVLELCKNRKIRLSGTQTDCTVTCTGAGDESDAPMIGEME